MDMITLRILTPSSGETHSASAVFLPGAMGSFEVLPGHAPIISALTAGEVRWRPAGVEQEKFDSEHEDGTLETIVDKFRVVRIKAGMMRFENNEMTVCCEV